MKIAFDVRRPAARRRGRAGAEPARRRSAIRIHAPPACAARDVDDLEPAVDVGAARVWPPRCRLRPERPTQRRLPPAPAGARASQPGPPDCFGRAATRQPRVMDSLDLGTTSITGNAELPKVLYIVPWKKSDLGDLVGRPVNTLLDEVLAPVDPEVFERHLSYYESLYGKQAKRSELRWKSIPPLSSFFQNGGVFMYPIVVVLALGVAIAVERWVYLTMTTAKNKALWNAVTPYLKAGNLAGAMQVTSKSDAAIGADHDLRLEPRALGAPPRGHRAGDGREPHGGHAAAREAHALSRDVREHGDAAWACSARSSASSTRSRPCRTRTPPRRRSCCRRSISIGMNCTAFGLMVAIPLVLVHSLLQTKTTEIIDSLEMASVKFLNAITERVAGDGQPGPAPEGRGLARGNPVPRPA